MLGISKQEARRHLNKMISECRAADIVRIKQLLGSDGVVDIGYRLERLNSKIILPKPKANQEYSLKNKSGQGGKNNKRSEDTEKAFKRARLIALGIYSTDMEALL